MVWTREKPTGDGFYWLEWPASDGSTRRQVVRVQGGSVRFYGEYGGMTVGEVSDTYCRWAGPIPEPTE